MSSLAARHLDVERNHDREVALERASDPQTTALPDWRLHRHILRIALYLRERMGIEQGDRVALVGPITPEWIIADWALVTQGAITVVIPPELSPAAFDEAWRTTSPSAAFVAGTEALSRVLALCGTPTTAGKIVTFDLDPRDEVLSYTQVLDLGGTLDTAERANAFRERARAVPADAPAAIHASASDGRPPAAEMLTHDAVVRRWRPIESAKPPRRGDRVYVRPDAQSVAAHIALYGLVSDGLTRAATGTPGREREEIARLDPRKVVEDRGAIERHLASRTTRSPEVEP